MSFMLNKKPSHIGKHKYSMLLNSLICIFTVMFSPLSKAEYTLINTDSVELNEAASLFKANKLDESKAAFKQILKKDNKSLDSLIYLSRINAKQEKLDDAQAYIDKALTLEPTNAYIQNLSGKIYASIAQDASVFTALGYAKQSLNGFKEAVKLEPSNIEYRQSLLRYYIGAPSIAGGDIELAKAQAIDIQALDSAQGFIAFTRIYGAEEDKKKLLEFIDNTPEGLLSNPEVLITKGFIYQQTGSYDKAILNFQNTITHAQRPIDETNSNNMTIEALAIFKYQALYQIGKTSDIGNISLSDGVIALTDYIDNAPQEVELPNKEWAQFRLANLIAKQGDKNKANSLYQSLAKNTDDKELKKQLKALL